MTPDSGAADHADAGDPHAHRVGVRGRDFRLLWAAFGASNLADGVLVSAGPLLVASLTDDARLVALGATLQWMPALLFGLLAGAVVDNVDRRRLQAGAHAARAVVLAMVAAALLTDVVALWMVYVAVFLLGTAETFADNAGQTLVVATVPPAEAGIATSRLIATSGVANRLAGPPIGALLLAVGLWLPFAVNGLLLLVAAVLVSRLSIDGHDPTRSVDGAPRASLRAQIAEGWRYTVATPPVRMLALLIAVFNLSFGAAYSVWVLWALRRLGLDEVGFGVVLTASAVGGLVGSALFPRLERRFRYATMLRVGLLVETGTHLALASTRTAWVAGAVLVVFGMHEAVWGSLSGAIRIRIVPQHLLGRVNSVYRLAVFGPLVLGGLLGGWLAESFGILTPFWYAGAGAGAATLWAWHRMDDLGDAGEAVPAVAV